MKTNDEKKVSKIAELRGKVGSKLITKGSSKEKRKYKLTPCSSGFLAFKEN